MIEVELRLILIADLPRGLMDQEGGLLKLIPSASAGWKSIYVGGFAVVSRASPQIVLGSEEKW